MHSCASTVTHTPNKQQKSLSFGGPMVVLKDWLSSPTHKSVIHSQNYLTVQMFQHFDEGKNLPGDRNLYPFPAGSRMERAPGLLLVETVGDEVSFLELGQWFPLEEFLLPLSSDDSPNSRSSRLSWQSLGEQRRGDRFRRLKTSLLAEARDPEVLWTALTGPRCCCWAAAFAQNVLRLWIAWTFSSMTPLLSRSKSGASTDAEQEEPVDE